MPKIAAALSALQDAVRRLDEVLTLWGFRFRLEGNDLGHQAFAAGWYERGPTRIGLIWRGRTGLGDVTYEWSEVHRRGYLQERIKWDMDHSGLMTRLGHADDCRLIEAHNGLSSVARDGTDAIGALMHDLREYAVPVIAGEESEFAAIMRQGRRFYDASVVAE